MPVVGTQQSPIKIVTADTLRAEFPDGYFKVEYANKPLSGAFKGHDFEFSQFAKITYRGKKQKLVKIHIHRPAEHRIDATEAAAFECHLLHVAEDTPTSSSGEVDLSGPKVVIGVFFHEEAGAATPASIKKLNTKLKARNDARDEPLRWRVAEAGEEVKINPVDFLPADRGRWYHYQGSLTTGTFSEDVTWFVMEPEIGVDPEDVKDLKLHAEQEARIVHAVDRRFVLRSFA